MKKVAIVGSRSYKRLDKVREFVMSLPLNTVIISGGASGVDSVAQSVAESRGMKVIVYKPEYDRYGSTLAPKMRNWKIAHECTECHSFWEGFSGGTAHVSTCMLCLNRPVITHLEMTLHLPQYVRDHAE